MEDNIFKPLQMNNTQPDIHRKIIPNRAKFYRRNKRHELKNSPYVDLSVKWAGGGFMSTAEDLTKFGYGMIHFKILKPETTKFLFTPQRLQDGSLTKYGLGWELAQSKEHSRKSPKLVVSHAGGAEGCTSQLYLVPEEDLVIAVIANLYSAKGIYELCQNLSTIYA